MLRTIAFCIEGRILHLKAATLLMTIGIGWRNWEQRNGERDSLKKSSKASSVLEEGRPVRAGQSIDGPAAPLFEVVKPCIDIWLHW